MRYMIISASGGVLGEAFTCEKLELALARGRSLWKVMQKLLGDYDPKAGVRRGYEAHWFNDDEDVWVIQPEVIA